MKAISGFIVVLLLSAALWAQGDSPDCRFCNGVRDYGCSQVLDPTSRDGCTSLQVTIPCDGDYVLTSKTECGGGYPCDKCMATTNIYDGDTYLGNCHTLHCDTGDCDEVCTNYLVHLRAGTYTLWVGLRFCVGSQCGTGAITDCNGSTCSAVGYIKSTSAGTPTCPSR